ncbi:recombinase RecF [Kribbella pittospori]|uniref:Nuclease SbcCD subunit C n=1 Tax=Kribbella pittospori TaxID=722689 RepID=A0A4R0KCE0_9ACTN|nr:AAA family ATPase [Kribbella pittospori]TCC55986.1 recombinase RecF [Kribbella pittospori]
MTDDKADDQQPGPGDESVVDTVVVLADQDLTLTERQKMLVLAAMESDEALADELGAAGESSTTDKSANAASTEVEPVGAFLTSITVSGFRGIGAEACLDLHPGPGLTVVAGRNGSGKSSFSEALEFALTGESYRWKGKKPFWTNAWRNLHQVQSTRIRIALAEEGHGPTEIGVDWAADGGLNDGCVWTQRHGKPRTTGVGALGWGEALELYRPILSYDELSQRLEGTQTDLYRSLESILGLDQIADGINRLTNQVKHLKAASDDASAAKSALKGRLENVDDVRARTVTIQLGKQKPDLTLVMSTALSSVTADGVGEHLRALSEMTVPDRQAVESAADELLKAVQQLAELASDASTRADTRSRLIEMALQFHSQHGDQTCPVCSGNVLDDEWHRRAQADLAADRASVAVLRSARDDLAARRTAARGLIDVPALPAADDELKLATLGEANAALKAWRDAPASGAELSRHLATNIGPVVDVLTRLRDEAAAKLSQRDDSWREVAVDVSEWVKLRRAAEASDQDLRDARASQTWLKVNAEKLRNQRLEPLAEKAKWIWSHLRRESNIDLDAITLSGQRSRGTVNLAARVDGEPAEGLPVMSQGELNAIAMALFLPRATMSASPLRFVVLDDPVQAMDPEKVDGLTEVLVEYAKDRQVIVFSHDDRLTESVRRTAPKARIVQVERGVDSKVQVVPCQSPAQRYIKDVAELLADENVPSAVISKAVPGYVRLAVEAAAHEVHFAKQLSKGTPRDKVEAAWESASTTSGKVALAMFGAKSFSLTNWQRAAHRSRTLGICRKGVHEGLTGSADGAVDDLRQTVDDILRQRK